MTESASIPPAQTPSREKRKRFIWFLAGVLLMTAATCAALIWAFSFKGVSVTAYADVQEVVELRQRVDALERQFNALVQLAPAQQAQNSAVPLDEELRKLKGMVESVEGRETLVARKALAAAIAYGDLRDEAKRGGAFDTQLAALREASDDPEVEELEARLSSYAAGGTMTVAQLRDELLIAERNVPPPEERKEADSVIAKIREMFKPLISVKPAHDRRFMEVESALDRGDVARALEAVRALPPEIKTTLELLEKHMEERADLDAAIKALNTYFMTVPVQRSAQ